MVVAGEGAAVVESFPGVAHDGPRISNDSLADYSWLGFFLPCITQHFRSDFSKLSRQIRVDVQLLHLPQTPANHQVRQSPRAGSARTGCRRSR